MAFVSQISKTRVSSRRGSSSNITMTQSFKKSTNSEELSIRIASECLKKIGLVIGDKADVLFDKDTDTWMIKKDEDGYKITGKQNAPTGLIRYTLKDGHKKFTSNRNVLPVNQESDDDRITYLGDKLTFRIKNKHRDILEW